MDLSNSQPSNNPQLIFNQSVEGVHFLPRNNARHQNPATFIYILLISLKTDSYRSLRIEIFIHIKIINFSFFFPETNYVIRTIADTVSLRMSDSDCTDGD